MSKAGMMKGKRMNTTGIQAQANMAIAIKAVLDHSVLTDEQKLHTVEHLANAAIAAASQVTTFTELS